MHPQKGPAQAEALHGQSPRTTKAGHLIEVPGLHAAERATGIEPASSAWEAEALPLSYARLAAVRVRVIPPQDDVLTILAFQEIGWTSTLQPGIQP